MTPIYLDHCASTPLCASAKRAMRELLDEDPFANAGASHHPAGRRAAELIADARHRVAGSFGTTPDRVVFTSGATEANNMVITGFALAHQRQGCRILVGATEHKSVLAPAERARTLGAQVHVLAVDSSGRLDMDELRRLLAKGDGLPTLVALMHVNNEIPVRHPVEEIGELCWDRSAAFHCDAVQGAVREQILFPETGASSLVVSAHKLGGPKGLGILLLNRSDARYDALPLLTGGNQEGGSRPGTPNTLAIVGAAAALEEHYERLGGHLDHLHACDMAFVTKMTAMLPGFRQTVPSSREIPGIVSFWIEGIKAKELAESVENVCLSRGAACASTGESSHVPEALGLPADAVEGVLRASFGAAVTAADVTFAAEALVRRAQVLLQKSRGPSPDGDGPEDTCGNGENLGGISAAG